MRNERWSNNQPISSLDKISFDNNQNLKHEARVPSFMVKYVVEEVYVEQP
jgi:hypothetical protein